MTLGTSQPELIGQQDRQEAIQSLLPPGSGRLQAARFERFATENRIGLDWLWACRDEQGEVLSSVLCVPSPGRTAMIFSSPVLEQSQVIPRGLLLDHVIEFLGSENIDLAQVLLSCDDAHGRASHLEAGFKELATLLYMERNLARKTDRPPAPDGIEIVTCARDSDEELAGILEASYEDTLDCPGLCGLRRTSDIIAGHRATGIHDPDQWKILRSDGRTAGVILLNETSAEDAIELVYLGMAREFRGQGLARHLLEDAISGLSGSSYRRMTLAVDTLNQPAIRLYERNGFRGTAHRLALIQPLVSCD